MEKFSLYFLVIASVFSLAAVASEEKKALAILEGKDVTGNITLTQAKSGAPVTITGTITGLKPGEHGFHIHEKGDLSGGCQTAGSHYNPEKKPHGPRDSKDRHVGDLGNVKADDNGIAVVNIVDNVITLFGRRTILGRAIVVHEGPDDLGKGGFEDSLTTGHAGGRVACGIIGVLQ